MNDRVNPRCRKPLPRSPRPDCRRRDARSAHLNPNPLGGGCVLRILHCGRSRPLRSPARTSTPTPSSGPLSMILVSLQAVADARRTIGSRRGTGRPTFPLADRVVADQVVGIAVADRDPVAAALPRSYSARPGRTARPSKRRCRSRSLNCVVADDGRREPEPGCSPRPV